MTYNQVRDIPNGDGWSIVSGSHECAHVLEHIGEAPEDWSHGSLFVRTEDGDYTDVVFFAGNVPYLDKFVTVLR